MNKEFVVTHKDDRQRAEAKADELLEQCQQQIKEKLPPSASVAFQIDALAECMQTQVNEHLTTREEERQFQSKLRTDMAQTLVPYACGDARFNENGTFSVEHTNRTWHFQESKTGRQKQYRMQVFHERPTSQIFTIEHFAGIKECEAIRPFVNDAVMKVPFLAVNMEGEDAKNLYALASKMYEVIRLFLEWNELDFNDTFESGHELFNVYRDDTVTKVPKDVCLSLEEEKKGECRLPGAPPTEAKTTMVEAPDSQLATMFLFCDEPADGLGGLHFPYSGVHINPEAGKLVVAIHRKRTDTADGFTQEWHLCPNHNLYTHGVYEK